ncbi:MAG TPA: trehalose-6-phosphate synthase [Steroidobacteraceae bacterium]|jgi:trehalose 6-phosphate synthase|nr:trehalose-6-phosphate synthase [Steroidobacteraceae bacterium]
MARLVNVSNRVSLPKGPTVSGGLAVGVLAAMRARGGLWFGWNGEITEQLPGDPDVTIRDGVQFATIPLPQALYDNYYCGFANGTLWPLFHYFLAGFRYEDAEYLAYEQANALFARTLAPLLQPSDLIWVHDYHLIPLAGKLRALGQRQPIGFFLHVPFPHFEVLRALPTFAEIMRALLAYDLVGFQTETDRHSFLGAVTRGWGNAAVADGSVLVGGRTIRTGVFPIGVDVDAIAETAAGALASLTVQRMVQGLVGRRLIIGVDRLDHSKGLLERFKAYRHFLETFPDQIGQVTYLQIAPLGRQNVDAYKRIRDSLEQSSGRTNGRFADADWTPIRYLNRNFPHATLMGFLRAAQVCLVTPVRDGMNLVAKEFVAAQDGEDPGVLILSNRTGSACELTDALLVNPYDTKGIAHAIQGALTMPLAERRERHAKLLAALRENDIHRWHSRFVQQLQDSGTAP